jgi:hypothetical protein
MLPDAPHFADLGSALSCMVKTGADRVKAEPAANFPATPNTAISAIAPFRGLKRKLDRTSDQTLAAKIP